MNFQGRRPSSPPPYNPTPVLENWPSIPGLRDTILSNATALHLSSPRSDITGTITLLTPRLPNGLYKGVIAIIRDGLRHSGTIVRLLEGPSRGTVFTALTALAEQIADRMFVVLQREMITPAGSKCGIVTTS